MLVVGVKKGRKEKAACCAISETGDAIQRGEQIHYFKF